MCDVNGVFVTTEVSRELDISTPYLIKLAKTLNIPSTDFRETAKGTYLFNRNAIEIIRKSLKKK